jgi:hypothetical protein
MSAADECPQRFGKTDKRGLPLRWVLPKIVTALVD